MTISIDWASKIISIPKIDTILVDSGPPEIRSINLETFRETLKNLEASEEGQVFDDTHFHVTEKTLQGDTYARMIEFINGYTVEFEDGQYTVRPYGANSNISDVKVQNQVSIDTRNSGGLIRLDLNSPDIALLTAGVWNALRSAYDAVGSFGEGVNAKLIGNSEQAATNLATASIVLPKGIIDDSTFTPTVTQFECNVLCNRTDAPIGRVIIFITGNLLHHAAEITGYSTVSGKGRYTVVEMPEAPANGDELVMH